MSSVLVRLATRKVSTRSARPIASVAFPKNRNISTSASSFDPPDELVDPAPLIAFSDIPPTFFEPFSSAILTVPPTLGLSMAILIPLFSFIMRTTTSLPLTFWQRARTRKFAEVVMPEIRNAQEIARLEVRAQCRRAGKTYDEYNVIYKERARKEASRLASQYSCRPLPTIVVPIMVQLPLFISTTLIIRDACQRSLTSLPLLPTNPFSSYTSQALSNLHDLAATPFLWCDSLVLPDPTLGLPLLVGLAALANVELGATTRAAVTRAMRAGTMDRDEDAIIEKAKSVPLRVKNNRDAAIRNWELTHQQPQRRSYAYAASQRRRPAVVEQSPMVPNVVVPEPDEPEEPRNTRLITNGLRVFAVLFIPIAAQAPTAVCLYWLSSNLYTLVQNGALAYVDRARERERVALRANRH